MSKIQVKPSKQELANEWAFGFLAGGVDYMGKAPTQEDLDEMWSDAIGVWPCKEFGYPGMSPEPYSEADKIFDDAFEHACKRVLAGERL